MVYFWGFYFMNVSVPGLRYKYTDMPHYHGVPLVWSSCYTTNQTNAEQDMWQNTTCLSLAVCNEGDE